MLNAIRFMPGLVAPCRPEIEHRPVRRSSPYLTFASSTAGLPEVTTDVTSRSSYTRAAYTAGTKRLDTPDQG
jgi:hypothetical protein